MGKTVLTQLASASPSSIALAGNGGMVFRCIRMYKRGVVLLYDLSSGPDKCLEDPFRIKTYVYLAIILLLRIMFLCTAWGG